MADCNITAFVLEHLTTGTAEPEIRRQLVETHGFTPHEAFAALENVKASNPDAMQLRVQHAKAAARQEVSSRENSAWFRTVLIGGGFWGLAIVAILAYELFFPTMETVIGSAGVFFVIGLAMVLKGIWHCIRKAFTKTNTTQGSGRRQHQPEDAQHENATQE